MISRDTGMPLLVRESLICLLLPVLTGIGVLTGGL